VGSPPVATPLRILVSEPVAAIPPTPEAAFPVRRCLRSAPLPPEARGYDVRLPLAPLLTRGAQGAGPECSRDAFPAPGALFWRQTMTMDYKGTMSAVKDPR